MSMMIKYKIYYGVGDYVDFWDWFGKMMNYIGVFIWVC